MKNISTHTAMLSGVEAVPVNCEVARHSGIPSVNMVGLTDAYAVECRARVRSALGTGGYTVPKDHFVISLTPSNLRKTGTGFDLSAAVGILATTEQIPSRGLDECLFVGEVGLDGRIRAVRGMVAYEQLARDLGLRLVCSPDAELWHDDDTVLRVESLEQLRAGVDRLVSAPATMRAGGGQNENPDLDYADIADQDTAKRAFVIAATGGHGLLMVGPPGVGKTMLARRLTTILPPLTEQETEEVVRTASVAGMDISRAAAGERPFRAPHHSITLSGLVGGGRPVLPGEVALANKGVLFLDDLPEFAPNALQALRPVVDEHETRIVRAEGVFSFPSDFALVAAANPCTCGHFGDPGHACSCSPQAIESYQSRLEGCLSGKFDIRLNLAPTPAAEILRGGQRTSSAEMRDDVARGLDFREWRTSHNAVENTDQSIVAQYGLCDRATAALEKLAENRAMSGRDIIRAAGLARTIADLDESVEVRVEDVLEALAFQGQPPARGNELREFEEPCI